MWLGSAIDLLASSVLDPKEPEETGVMEIDPHSTLEPGWSLALVVTLYFASAHMMRRTYLLHNVLAVINTSSRAIGIIAGS